MAKRGSYILRRTTCLTHPYKRRKTCQTCYPPVVKTPLSDDQQQFLFYLASHPVEEVMMPSGYRFKRITRCHTCVICRKSLPEVV